jgi:hypothetical protein
MRTGSAIMQMMSPSTKLANGMAGFALRGLLAIGALFGVACAPADDSLEGEGLGEESSAIRRPLVCNGSALLCDRRFNEVAFPATHNAMSALEEGFANSDQRYGIARQLADGIRAMELDVWSFQPSPGEPRELYLCHGGACSPGRRKLSEALRDIAAFLDSHPNEVLTLLFEDHAPAVEIFAALDRAGLLDRLHTQKAKRKWPTLRQLIKRDKRLVATFEQQYDPNQVFPRGYQYAWEYAFDTTWEFTDPSDFNKPDGSDCDVYRGSGTNGLFILNHMLDTGPRAEEFARVVNQEDVLLTRMETCRDLRDHIPNFVKVDYYDIGDLFSSVRKLNGLP